MGELRKNSKTIRKVLLESRSEFKFRHIITTVVKSADGRTCG